VSSQEALQSRQAPAWAYRLPIISNRTRPLQLFAPKTRRGDKGERSDTGKPTIHSMPTAATPTRLRNGAETKRGAAIIIVPSLN
jgi:hypothetical protein